MKVIFYLGEKSEDKKIVVESEEGLSLLEVARNNDIPLYGNCGGYSTCGSCHIVVVEDDVSVNLNKTNPATDLEIDTIEQGCFNAEKKSRLGCQVFLSQKILTKDMEGFEVIIPN